MDRAKLRAELIRDEGMRLEAYTDSVGLWTIGVGHLLGTEKRMVRITPAECEALLSVDIDDALFIARRLAPGAFNNIDDPYATVRERVLVNMAFNLGSRLGQFKKFLAAVNAHDWTMAAVQMMQSKWAGQVGARATRLRYLLLTED